MHLKARLLALALILLSIGLIYLGWHQLLTEGRYSLKLAAFSPVIGVGGFFLLIFPSMAGKPTTAKEKIIVLAVLVIGMLAGLLNWYLMDPGFFGR
jgi:peptidoglycan biosynthesis protein MviN/MurJ (putative lipid II flippase)